MKEPMNDSFFVPEGWHTLTPRIVAQEARQLVEFLKRVFGGWANNGKGAPPLLKSAIR